MLQLLFLAFIVVPIVEIAVLVQVGSVLGAWPTIAIVILSAMIGATLMRSQGLATLQSVQQRLAQGEIPGKQIVEGAMLLFAGALLLTPGFVTDILGISVLIPQVRSVMAEHLMRHFQGRVVTSVHSGGFEGGFGGGFETHTHTSNHTQHANQHHDPHTIDGEFTRKD